MSPRPSFDATLATSILPRLERLSQLHSASTPAPSTPGSTATAPPPSSNQETTREASQLRIALASLREQANAIEAGHMSLDDQDWLVQQLEKELSLKRLELDNLVKLTSVERRQGLATTTEGNEMETDP
ncbi:hypothetical protein JCM10212_004363 [Sporobolomyces blumeae]